MTRRQDLQALQLYETVQLTECQLLTNKLRVLGQWRKGSTNYAEGAFPIYEVTSNVYIRKDKALYEKKARDIHRFKRTLEAVPLAAAILKSQRFTAEAATFVVAAKPNSQKTYSHGLDVSAHTCSTVSACWKFLLAGRAGPRNGRTRRLQHRRCSLVLI